MKKQLTIALGVTFLLAGCGSTEEQPQQKEQNLSGIPEWVTSPTYQDGTAVTECVPATSNFSMDRKEALANARQGLAQQINLKVEAMDQTYQRRTRGQEQESSGSTFESVSRQVTQTRLDGSRIVKTGYVDLGGTKNLCVMAAFGSTELQEIFDGIIDASGESVDPQDEELLYQEFKAEQAREALDEQLNQ
jgi:hypothetical protein